MAARLDPLFCPACGDREFYTSFALPAGATRWVVDADGVVSVWQGDEDLAVITPVVDDIYCAGCHTLVTGRAVVRVRASYL